MASTDSEVAKAATEAETPENVAEDGIVDTNTSIATNSSETTDSNESETGEQANISLVTKDGRKKKRLKNAAKAAESNADEEESLAFLHAYKAFSADDFNFVASGVSPTPVPTVSNAPQPTPAADTPITPGKPLTLEEQANREIQKCLAKAMAILDDEKVKSGNITDTQKDQLQLAAEIAKEEINDNEQLSADKKQQLLTAIDDGLNHPEYAGKNAGFVAALQEVQVELKKDMAASTTHAEIVSQHLMSKDPVTGNAIYTGSIITRRMPDGSPSPYTAHYTPDKKITIKGDFKEGFKDILQLYKETGANIQYAKIGGAPLSAEDGYAVIKMGVEANVVPVLEDRGILGSAQLFAEEGAKTNPDGCEADTKAYFEQIVANTELRAELITEMNAQGLEVPAEIEDTALVNKAVEHVVTPKPAAKAEAETVAETQSKAEAPPYRPTAKKPPSGGLGTAAAASAPAPDPKEKQKEAQQEKKSRTSGSLRNPFELPTLKRE